MKHPEVVKQEALRLKLLDASWRAANHLSVGQIYLRGNPLLHEPLRREHVKPRLLGHWGTTPGLKLSYIRECGQDLPEIRDWVWPH